MKFVYTHLGLGDHIVCNGLVRELVKRHGPLTTFAKPHNAESVRFMFHDVPVAVVEANDAMAGRIINSHPAELSIVIGHYRFDRTIPFDRCFYLCAGVPFASRWESFNVPRDAAGEKRVIDALKLPQQFAFLHDDPARDYTATVKTSLPVVRPKKELTANIFDYMGVIERAAEVHCIESAFAFMVDSFPMDKPLFIHRYARHSSQNEKPTYKNEWKVIE